MAGDTHDRALMPALGLWWKSSIAFTVILALTGTLSHHAHRTLLSLEALAVATGPQEGYYWTVAQYQIFLERMDRQLLRYAAGPRRDAAALELCHSLLQSKFRLLTESSELTPFFESMPEYRLAAPRLRTLMRALDGELLLLPRDPAMAARIAQRFDTWIRLVSDLANAVRMTEMRRREDILADFAQKRCQLHYASLCLWALFVLWVLLLLQGRRRARRLLAAEQRASQAAHAAIHAKNTFLGMVSHELRTPLQTILSSIDVLDLKKPAVDRRNANVMRRLSTAAMQLDTQMRDLTDYARLDIGRLELRMTSFDPAEKIAHAAEEYRAAALRKGLRLDIEVPAEPVRMQSDPYRLQQIVGNLVGNAVKYTRQGGISVTAAWRSRQPSHLRLTVADTGPGIHRDDLPLLYKPFTQIDQSSTRRYDGAGMGLAIVKRLVELFGGAIEVQSELGRSTVFTVSIPAAITPTGATARRLEEAVSIHCACDVLLVDDNADVTASLGEVLEQMGYRCEIAANGAEALRKLAENTYAVVLLDMHMPDMNGVAVAARVRAGQGPNRNVPIIAISAAPMQPDARARHSPLTGFLLKPVRRAELALKLKELVHPAPPPADRVR